MTKTNKVERLNKTPVYLDSNDSRLKGTIFEGRDYYKPFSYPKFFELFDRHEKMHWIVDEIPMDQDIQDWNQNMSEDEVAFVKEIFRFFTQTDIDVLDGYDKLIQAFKDTPEIAMCLASIAAREGIHVQAYSTLLDTVGMDESEYSSFHDNEVMVQKHELLEGTSVESVTDVALTCATTGAFAEGLQLFSSFAMLFNFERFNKMKGMCKVVEWSIRDESCVDKHTEVLTNEGFKYLPDLDGTEKVAQWKSEDQSIEFVRPIHIIESLTEREHLYEFKNHYHVNQMVTEDHDMVYWMENKGHVKKQAEDFVPCYRRKIPVSGFLNQESSRKFTAEDALRVALQADGSIPSGKYRNGNYCGYRRCNISLKKPRKIQRLKEILSDTDLNYDVVEYEKDKPIFKINIPMELNPSKNFYDWVSFDELNQEWCEAFIEEVSHWDGHRTDEHRILYCSTDKACADFVQACASMCGYRAAITIHTDDRKPQYSDVYRVNITKDFIYQPTGRVTKTKVPYNDKVYCVQVPSGAFVSRREGVVNITGNCHVEACMELFKVLKAEFDLDEDQLEQKVVDLAKEMVRLEDGFIDLCFDAGNDNIKGISREDTKTYIRFMCNHRLEQLGYEPIFDDVRNPYTWLDEMVHAVEHANFFESRSTEYTKGATQGSWDEAF